MWTFPLKFNFPAKIWFFRQNLKFSAKIETKLKSSKGNIIVGKTFHNQFKFTRQTFFFTDLPLPIYTKSLILPHFTVSFKILFKPVLNYILTHTFKYFFIRFNLKIYQLTNQKSAYNFYDILCVINLTYLLVQYQFYDFIVLHFSNLSLHCVFDTSFSYKAGERVYEHWWPHLMAKGW